MNDEVARQARSLARSLPEDLQVLGVVTGASASEREFRALVELAAEIGRTRRTLLANVRVGEAGLDEFLGQGDRPGVLEVAARTARLGESAVQVGSHPFLYLPVGSEGTAGPQVTKKFRSVVERLRDAGGTFLLHLGAAQLDDPALSELLEGAVLVGDARLPPTTASEVRQLGRLSLGLPDEGAGREVPSGAGETGEADDDFPAFVLEEPSSAAAASRPGDPDEEAGGAEGEEAAASGPASEEASEPAFRMEPAPDGEAAGREDASPSPGGEPSAPGEEEMAAASGPGTPGDASGPTEDAPVRPLEPSAAAAGTPAEEASGDAGSWRRHRRRSRPPWGRIAAGVAVVAALAGGWWYLARGAPWLEGGPAPPDARVEGAAAPASGAAREEAEAARPAGTGEEGPAAESGGAEASGTAGDGGGPDPVDAAYRDAPELPYSVLVASYASREDAMRRLRGFRAGGEALYFVVPTDVRGDVYYRLLAGAFRSREAARRLMDRLVEAGVKDAANDWHLRPVRLAYRLGGSRERAAAVEERDGLEERGVPSYVLPAPTRGDTAFLVYAGGYDAEEAAEPMERILAEAGITARLGPRRGRESEL